MGICGSKAPSAAGAAGGSAGGGGGATSGAASAVRPVNDASKLTSQEKQELRKKTNIVDRDGDTIVRRPGDIDGWDMQLEGCTKCKVLVFDRIGALNGDDCEDCDVIIGPCTTSVFLRNFKRCRIVVACAQFRARGLEDCTILMSAQSRPVIESSRKLSFGCHTLSYPQLPQQMALSGLSPLCNPWYAIHDFTPNPLSYSLLNETEQEAVSTELRLLPACAEVGADFGRDMIPKTFGSRPGRPPATVHGVFVADPDPGALVAKLVDLSSGDGVKVIRTDVQSGSGELLTALKSFAGAAVLPPALVKAAKSAAQLVCVEVAGQSAAPLASTLHNWGALAVPDGGQAEFLFPNYQDQGGRLQ